MPIRTGHCGIVITDHLFAHVSSHRTIATLNTRPAGCGGASVAQAKGMKSAILLCTCYSSKTRHSLPFPFVLYIFPHIFLLHICSIIIYQFRPCAEAPLYVRVLEANTHGSQCERPPRSWRVCTEQVRHFIHPIVLLIADSRTCRLGQIWDPTLGAYRAQRLPLALSKSSVAANATNGHFNGQGLYRPPTSASYASTASNPNSFTTAYTYSSTPTSPGSLFSHHSNSSSQVKARWKPPPRAFFQNLPPEVYDCILQQLRIFHEDPRSLSCQTCHMRDLCSLSMTNRAWDKAVVKRL